MKWAIERDANGDADYVSGDYRITWCYDGMCFSSRKRWFVQTPQGELKQGQATLREAKALAERHASNKRLAG